MKIRILQLGLILAISVAIIAAALHRPQGSSPQIVTLSTGQQYRLAGITYGTKHVQGPVLARLANRLPTSVTNLISRKLLDRFGKAYSFQTPEPALGVWFEPVVTNAGLGMSVLYSVASSSSFSSFSGASSKIQALLADENGVLAGKVGESLSQASFARLTSGPFPIFFPLVPNRSRMIECCLFSVPAAPEGACREIGRVRFPNPVFHRASAWKSESLPNTQQTGDLKVRLDHLTTGKPAPGTPLNFLTSKPAPGSHLTTFQPVAIGEEAWTGFDFTLNSPTGADANWVLHSADLSDPAGNHLQRSWSTLDQWPYQFMVGTLWPNEAAWRLTLEFKRTSGFAPAELITFTNVPLLKAGMPSRILRTNNIHGLGLVLMEYSSGVYSSSTATVTPRFQLETPKTQGTAFDFVQLVTDQGETVVMREMLNPSQTPGAPLTTPPRILLFGKDPPTNATTVNLTWAMQKTRSVDFLVQPPKP